VADPADEKSKPRQLEVEGSASALQGSPAGNQLALALAPTPLVDDDLMARKVHVIDADTGKVVARFDNPGKLGPFALSPDGRQLAFVSAADINDPDAGRLMVVPASGGAARDLLPGIEYDVADIAWQDANSIMFIADEGVWTTFNRINADGSGGRTTIIKTGPAPGGATLAPPLSSGRRRSTRPKCT
jgi:Tol biopolymer transport system component